MKLLPVLALSFVIGAALREPAAGAVVLATVLAVRPLRRHRTAALALLLGTLLPAAAPGTLLRALPDGAPLVRVTGTVLEGPDLPLGRTAAMTVEVETVGGRPLSGHLLVLIPEDAPETGPGDRVEVTGRLVRPRGASNPGEGDPRQRLATRGVGHLLLVRSPRSIVVRDRTALAPRSLVHSIRAELDARLAALPHRRASAILSCLLLGRRDRVPDEVLEDFRRTGTTHFLAISGLHVGILAGTLWLLLRLVAAPRALAGPAVVIAVVLYAAVTGARPPVVRAALLVVLTVLGMGLRRRPRPLHLLGLAAVAIVATDPGAVGRVGFQLSFTAVLAILHLTRPFEAGLFARWILLEKFSLPRKSPLHLVRRYVRKGVPVSLAAWLGTGPIILVRFGTLSLLVVPANLLVLPFITLLLPAGLLAAATGIDAPAAVLVDGLTGLVRLLAAIPGASHTLPAPALLLLPPYYAALLFAGRRASLGRLAAAALVSGLLALAVSGVLLRRAPAEPRATVLAVGPGLAVTIETPEGGVAVYDVGSRRRRVFERVVLPFLRHRRIRRLDLLVLSHLDTDHVSGAAALLRTLSVGRSRPPGSLRAGDEVEIPGALLEVLWPPPGRPAEGNDGSTVIRLSAGGLTMLLAGDLEEEGLAGLLASGRDVRADVLLLPHHGRPTPLAGALLRAVRPRILVSSDGPGDPLDPCYAGAFRTSESGAITVRPGGRVETFR